jgi:Tol biopolymer transport system component
MKTTWQLLVALLAAGAAFAATAGAAQAAFPGANGTIVFQSNRDGNAEIYTMNSDGTNRVNLTRNPAEDTQPRWSPDGTRIVFVSNRTGSNEIYSMDQAGGDLLRLTSSSANNQRPSWTADGRILFHSDRDGNRELYLMNADGSGLRNLTRSPSDDAYAAGAPRGDRVVFTSDRAGPYELYLLNLNQPDSPPRPITDGESQDFEANWSPSGNDLVFVRFDQSFDSSEIYTVHANGSDLRQLTNTPGRIEFEPAWSPDGTEIVFHACTDLGGPSQHCANYVINRDGTAEAEVTKTPTAPFSDDFNDGVRDPFWHVIQDPGSTVQEVNGRLELAISGSAVPGGQFDQVDAHYGSNCTLPGDFDMQVDYSLTQWPAGDGMFAGLSGIFASAAVFRNSPAIGDSYTAFSGPVAVGIPTMDLSGSFRLVRAGSLLTAYYRGSGDTTWTQLLAAPATPGNAVVGLGLQTPASSFGHRDASVAFDNFRLNGGQLSCPTWWDDDAPDWRAG